MSIDFKVSPSNQRYWLWKRGDGDSAVLGNVFSSLTQENKRLISLHGVRDPVRSADKKNKALMVVNVFLELPPPDSPSLREIQSGEILLFIKFYDPLKVDLEYIGSLYVGRKTYFGSILDRAKRLAKVHKDLEIVASKLITVEPSVVTCDLFAQSTPYQVICCIIRASKLFGLQNDLGNGDVIIIQPKMITLKDFLSRSSKCGLFEDDSTLGKI